MGQVLLENELIFALSKTLYKGPSNLVEKLNYKKQSMAISPTATCA